MSIKKTLNGRYQVRFRDETSRQRSKSFTRKKDAEAFKAKVKVELQNGVWLDPVAGSASLEEVWQEFYDLKKAKKTNTQADYQSIWSLHVGPKWGRTPVSTIKQIDFDKWVVGINLSPQRLGKIHLVMSMLLDHAVKKKILRQNPLKDALGKRDKSNLPTLPVEIATEFLSLTELMAVAQASGYYKDVILTLGLCGPRWSELVGLRVKDLNVVAGTITIRRGLVEVNGKLEVSTTKNHRQRIVELPEILKDVCHEWVFNKDPDDPLFHTLEGKHLRNTNFTRRVFIPALAKAGIKKIRIHDLRHTAASIAISAGATPNMVKEMLGHSDVQMTMRIYAHIFEADREKVAASVNRAVKEVHQMCMDAADGIVKPAQLSTKNSSEQGFSFGLQTWNHGRTSDYESGALTN